MYFEIKVGLDEKWTKKLLRLFDLKGSSNTALSEVVEKSLRCGIAEQLRALRKGKRK